MTLDTIAEKRYNVTQMNPRMGQETDLGQVDSYSITQVLEEGDALKWQKLRL